MIDSGTELSVTGGSPLLVLTALFAGVVTIALGLAVAVVAYRGYRRTAERSMLFLAAGIVLLAAVSTTFRFVLSTIGSPLLVTNAAAAGSELVGLSLILYAIYGRPDRRAAAADGSFAAVFPLAAIPAVRLTTLVNALSAGVGLFVAIQAYRGYLRHASRPMLFLAAGIGLLTVVPFTVEHALVTLTDLIDAAGILLLFVVQILGLASILYALTRA